MRSCFRWFLIVFLGLAAGEASAAEKELFAIQVVDQQTGRGVPLVELRTTHGASYVTDSGGWVAFDEPDLMGVETWLEVKSHGYRAKKDGFGYSGVRLTPKPGEEATIKVERINIAERLYRITGAGIYADSWKLGKKTPLEPELRGGVVGQDSVQAALYQGKIYWFWGDTTLARYPLGNFRTAGATTPLAGPDTFDPAELIPIRYFVDENGQSRAMIPLADDPQAKEGPVWIDGVITVPDDDGNERLVCHYERMRDVSKRLAHGMAVWNDERQIFESKLELPVEESWRCLRGHPLRHTDEDGEYVYCGAAMPNVRVPARLSAVLDPEQYEAWTPLAENKVDLDRRGQMRFSWRKGAPPWSTEEEEKRRIDEEMRVYHPLDVATGRPVKLHGGSVRWNAFRQKFVLIAVEIGGKSSLLGEVWYSEAPSVTGPWRRAVKVATHDKYSFYNPVHHPFLDAKGGRYIYFEGTYSHTFSGNERPTPRYDYNQILYRLDLSDPRLQLR